MTVKEELYDIQKKLETGELTYERELEYEKSQCIIVSNCYKSYVRVVKQYIDSLFDKYGVFEYDKSDFVFYLDEIEHGFVESIFISDDQETIDDSIYPASISIEIRTSKDSCIGFDIPQNVIFGTVMDIQEYVHQKLVKDLEYSKKDLETLENKINKLKQQIKIKTKVCNHS